MNELDASLPAGEYAAMQAAGETWWFTYVISNDDNAPARLKAVFEEHVPMAGIQFEDQGDDSTKLKIEAPYRGGQSGAIFTAMVFATQMLHAGLAHAGLPRETVLWRDDVGTTGSRRMRPVLEKAARGWLYERDRGRLWPLRIWRAWRWGYHERVFLHRIAKQHRLEAAAGKQLPLYWRRVR